MFVIREINANDKEIVTQLIAENWGSSIIVSKGKAYDVSSLPGFVAESDGKITGLITYNVHGNDCEITTLDSYTENSGIGSKLIEEVIKIARENNCYRIWLITTNDNTNLEHIAFLEYLRNHPDDMYAYGKLKLELAEQYKTDINSYVKGKADFVENILQKAKIV